MMALVDWDFYFQVWVIVLLGDLCLGLPKGRRCGVERRAFAEVTVGSDLLPGSCSRWACSRSCAPLAMLYQKVERIRRLIFLCR